MTIVEELAQNPDTTLGEWKALAFDLQNTVEEQRRALDKLVYFAEAHGVKYEKPDDVFEYYGFFSLVHGFHDKLLDHECRLARVDRFLSSLR